MAGDERPIRLLLVDDEVGYLEVLGKRLAKRDFQVTTARSGTQAIRCLRDHDFDVAVVDLKMEDMDGIELLKVLKQMLPELQVIMLTGHGSERAARDGLALGAFDYLLKPIDLEILLERVLAAVGRGGDGS
ncbi:MAG: response regulator [Thermoanaerobaculales bacterium]|nr:response regulator [Thermoanaerobaculales bacterium]